MKEHDDEFQYQTKIADMSPQEAHKGSLSELDQKKSPWRSIWISIGMQFIVGVQTSIYYMSMWPYLSSVDRTATVDFLGWVIAACSLGCSVANPLFGLWNQKTMSIKAPVIVGMIMMIIGQGVFGILPLFSSGQKWIMLSARLLTGIGAAVFTPVGEHGFRLGSVIFNMYTMPAFFMVLLSIVCCIIIKLFFKEEYAGIIEKKQDEGKNFMVIPKFDMVPAVICIYLWMVSCMVATNIEVISTPWSVVMYNWKDSDAVLYNGIFQTASCLVSSGNSFLIGYTRIGQIEKRKQILFGITVFLLFHIFNFPWPFYAGPLDYIPEGKDSSEVGGCLPSYKWCESTVRVPFPIYMICFVFFFGVSFPFTGSPSATLYSQILGPRKQGTMQGIHSFGGSIAQCVAPILTTYLFKYSGYKYVMVTQICTLGLALVLVIVFYQRLVPLRLKPEPGKATKYKDGIFYVM
ncbi:hypothetical protein V3C99_008901 [Haemonchus contortus]|uniref:MFS domain-containing protein n=1 Tax=Haemonchus contortus TaxID=6289 RepID=A0A7I4YKB0_HAECO